MASTATLTGKYIVTFLVSTGFWIVPVSVKAPRLGVLASFLASLTGYTACFCMAGAVEDEQEFNQLERTQKKELVVHRYSLEEMAMKQLMEAEFFGSPVEVKAEPEAIAVAAQQRLAGQPQRKQLPPEATLPMYLQLVIQLAQSNGGSISVREVMRAPGIANQFTADEIKSFFAELQERGKGTVTTNRNSTKFHLS
jgi:hypothetical protein